VILLVVDAQAGVAEEDAQLARRCGARRRRSSSSPTRWTPPSRRPTWPRSSGWGSASRSPCRPCTDAPPATSSTGSWPAAGAAARRGGRGRAAVRDRGARRTWASRACSTGSWVRSAASCSRRRAPRVTPSTRSSRGHRGRCGSSTRPACAAPSASRRRVLQLRAREQRRSSAPTWRSSCSTPSRVHGRGQEDRRARARGRTRPAARRNKWDLVEEKDRTYKRLNEEAEVFAAATVVRTSALRGTGVPRLPGVLTGLHQSGA
jgi:hypothetical protein